MENTVSSSDWKLDPLVQVRWDFGDCGKTGMNGPSSSDCDEYYLDTNLEMNVRVNSGVQSWVVPADGLYLVTVRVQKSFCFPLLRLIIKFNPCARRLRGK